MNGKHLLAVSVIFTLIVPALAKQDSAMVRPRNGTAVKTVAHTRRATRVVSSARVLRAKQTTALMQLGQQGMSAHDPADQTITVTINNEPVTFEATSQPMLSGRRIMIPLRGIVEKLGGTVVYDPESQVIAGVRSANNKPFQVHIGSDHAVLNGKDIALDAAPQVINGTIYVPLRFISEALGAKVNWQPRQNTVFITVNSTITTLADEPTLTAPYPALHSL